MSVFSMRLHIVRKSKRVTQGQVSEDLGVPKSTWSGWERGLREPSYRNLVAIADYFKVSLDWLLGRTEEATLNSQQFEVSEDVIAAGVALRDMVLAMRKLVETKEGLE